LSIWHYIDDDRQRQGPLSTGELKERFQRDAIGPETLVWREGMLAWRPLGELAEQLGLVPAPTPEPVVRGAVPPPEPEPEPEPPPPLSGRAVFSLGTEPVQAQPVPPAAAGYAVAQAERNPYAPSRAPLQAHAATHAADVVYAGFWKRAAASLIDGFIVGLAGKFAGKMFAAILADVTGGGPLANAVLELLLTLALNACYFAWFHSQLALATPGKMVIGIKVVRSDGEPIGFLRGVARYFATIVSAIPLGIGYLMAAFTERKRALHDMLCDTVVVDKWAFTGHPGMQRRELGTATIVVLAGYALLILALVFVAGLAGALASMR
jgi:uncharacterized RDD family membrane protein YckC